MSAAAPTAAPWLTASVRRPSPGSPFVPKHCSQGLPDGILILGVQSPRAISPICSQADTVPSFVICPVLLGLFRSWGVCFICHFPSLPTPCPLSCGGPVFSQPLHLPPRTVFWGPARGSPVSTDPAWRRHPQQVSPSHSIKPVSSSHSSHWGHSEAQRGSAPGSGPHSREGQAGAESGVLGLHRLHPQDTGLPGGQWCGQRKAGWGQLCRMRLPPSRLGPVPPSTSVPAGAPSLPLLTCGTLPTGPRGRPQGCEGCEVPLLSEVLGATAVGSLSRCPHPPTCPAPGAAGLPRARACMSERVSVCATVHRGKRWCLRTTPAHLTGTPNANLHFTTWQLCRKNSSTHFLWV